MKFSITKLEQARKNPAEFAKQLKTAKPSENFNYPKSMRWLNAIKAFHKNNKVSDAFDSIEYGFRKRKKTPKNDKELETFFTSINNYVKEISDRKLLLIKSRESIDLKLTSRIKITGMIPIIFMKPKGGFATYFISTSNPSWRNELKFPIVQSYVAEEIFSTDVKEIEVGYIDYFTGEFIETSFSKSKVKNAIKELKSIGEKISINL